MNYKRTSISFLAIFLVVSMLSYVLAAGVTSEYYTGNPENEKPLPLLPGESKEIYFNLQNLAGDNQTLVFKASIIKGQSLAKVTDTNEAYVVPYGSKDIRVTVLVTAPRNATVGQRYNVGLSFPTVPGDQSQGQFKFGSAYEKYFDVVITNQSVFQQPPADSSNSTWLPYLIIIVLIIGFLVFLNRKNKQ